MEHICRRPVYHLWLASNFTRCIGAEPPAPNEVLANFLNFLTHFLNTLFLPYRMVYKDYSKCQFNRFSMKSRGENELYCLSNLIPLFDKSLFQSNRLLLVSQGYHSAPIHNQPSFLSINYSWN